MSADPADADKSPRGPSSQPQRISATTSSNGATNNQADTPALAELRNTFAQRIRANFDIIDANRNFSFPSGGEGMKMNDKYWEAVRDPSHPGKPSGFRLRQGVSASVALDDALRGETQLACGPAMHLAVTAAIRDLMGRAAFDQRFGMAGGKNANLGFESGPGVPTPLMTVYFAPASVSDRSQILPGDAVYFNNAADKNGKPIFNWFFGQNAIYIGGGLFSGLGTSRRSEEEINRELFNAYRRTEGRLKSGTTDLLEMKDWLSMKAPKQGGNSLDKPVGLDLSSIWRVRIDMIAKLIESP